MAQKDDKELVRVNLRLYKSDLEAIRRLYPNVGYNMAVRRIVHKRIRFLEERDARRTTSGSAGEDYTL